MFSNPPSLLLDLPAPNDPPARTHKRCAVLHTYAIACPGFIKVGRAEHVRRRIATLQIGNPYELELLGFHLADIERECHQALVARGVQRVRGEWFVDTKLARDVLRAAFTGES